MPLWKGGTKSEPTPKQSSLQNRQCQRLQLTREPAAQPFGGTAHRLTADEETTKETDEVQKDSAVSDESNTDSAESNTDSPISLKPDIIR